MAINQTQMNKIEYTQIKSIKDFNIGDLFFCIEDPKIGNGIGYVLNRDDLYITYYWYEPYEPRKKHSSKIPFSNLLMKNYKLLKAKKC